MYCLFVQCISPKMERFYFQPLLLILFIVLSEYRAFSPDTETVSGHQEADIALSCLNSNWTGPKSCYRVKCIKFVANASRTEVIFMSQKKLKDAKRVKWEADGDGRRCLYLLKLQKSDEGLYGWEIWHGWDIVLTKNISVKVKDCKALPPVTAAPSTSVQLNCPANVTSGWQNVSWAMQKGNNHVSVSSKRVQINDKSLVIRSVTTSDSGWYRCSYMLGETQRCLVTNLQVQEVRNMAVATTVRSVATKALQVVTAGDLLSTNSTEEGSEALIALVASVVLGIVVIAALIGLFVYRRSKNQSITYRGQPADPVADYECVILPGSVDPVNMQPNSLYQDETLYTFLY